MKRDLLSIADLTMTEIEGLFERARHLKEMQKANIPHPTLAGKTLGMIFMKPSTRTRVSFEVGMLQLGGHAIFLPASELQIGRGETIADSARVLSRYVQGIVIRAFAHADVEELARHATVPVINGLSDLLHPCQVLSDCFTIREHFGSLTDRTIAYFGDGNNVANSWLIAAAKLQLTLALACPEHFRPDPGVRTAAEQWAAETGATIRIVREPAEAAAGADVLYTDVWASMGREAEVAKRRAAFADYTIDEHLLRLAHPSAVVMHCLPAHRDEEIASEVADGPASIIFEQAENRLHLQKALLEFLMGEKGVPS
ncbi:MAG: ornithine carbamoyltransferase [Nitrospinota bacterium]